MGKSKSIKELDDQNKAFQTYLQDIQNQLQTRYKDDLAKFDANVKAFYGEEKYKNVVIITMAERYDFRQVGEVTLDNIKKVIDSVVETVFPGDGQSKEMTDDAQKAMESVKNYKDVAAELAKVVVFAALDAFSASSELKTGCEFSSESICPGVTMHLMVANDSYRDKNWFNNAEIVQTCIKYALVFSYDLAMAEVDIEFIQNKIAEMREWEVTVAELGNTYKKMLLDMSVKPEELQVTKMRYDAAKDEVEAARKAVDDVYRAHTSRNAAIGLTANHGAVDVLPGQDPARIALVQGLRR